MGQPTDPFEQLASDADWKAIDAGLRERIFAAISAHAEDAAFEKISLLLTAIIEACNHTLDGVELVGDDMLILHLTDKATGRSSKKFIKGWSDPRLRARLN